VKQKHEIIEDVCKPYGGFVDVVTRYGSTFISQLWIKSMEEYALQQNQTNVIGSLPDIETFDLYLIELGISLRERNRIILFLYGDKKINRPDVG